VVSNSKSKIFNLILNTVRKIPRGKVATYGQIATIVGTQNPRLVGYALASLNENTDVPWFRVINSQGKISFPYNSKAYKIQHSLLTKEGVRFSDRRIINLNEFGWSEANE
jgi:methylated-DNA-protein-cysteine methyltransferase-like protein